MFHKEVCIIEQTETKIEIIKQVIHHFYCDNCGEFLGTVKECDDGFYDKPGEYNLALHVNDCWFRYNQQLCEGCRQQFINTLKGTLLNMKFKPE